MDNPPSLTRGQTHHRKGKQKKLVENYETALKMTTSALLRLLWRDATGTPERVAMEAMLCVKRVHGCLKSGSGLDSAVGKLKREVAPVYDVLPPEDRVVIDLYIERATTLAMDFKEIGSHHHISVTP